MEAPNLLILAATLFYPNMKFATLQALMAELAPLYGVEESELQRILVAYPIFFTYRTAHHVALTGQLSRMLPVSPPAAKTMMLKFPKLIRAANIEKSVKILQGLLTSSHVLISLADVVSFSPSLLLMSLDLLQQKCEVIIAAWALHPDWPPTPEDVTAPMIKFWLDCSLKRLERLAIMATTGQTLLPRCSTVSSILELTDEEFVKRLQPL
jgi:hypothetical protein